MIRDFAGSVTSCLQLTFTGLRISRSKIYMVCMWTKKWMNSELYLSQKKIQLICNEIVLVCKIWSYFSLMHKRDRWGHAEDVVANRLETKWVHIIQRNRTMRWGEIDIIAQKDDLLLIVEVRSVDQIHDLQAYMPAAKMKHLIRSSEHRIHLHRWDGPVRIDVVYVRWDSVVEWFQNVTNT